MNLPADGGPSERLAYPHATVLVAEDSRVNQMLMRRLLGHFAVEPHIAEDGQQALDAVAASHYDLIFMDCEMPVLDGYDVARAIRAGAVGNRAVPIVALTGHGGLEHRRLSFAAGMNDHLHKPVTLERMSATLRRWLPPVRA